MATVLLAVVIALAVGHVVPDLARLRQFGWFESWLGLLGAGSGRGLMHSGSIGIAIAIGVPVLLLALLQQALDGALFGLASLALGVLALFFCWGPRDLDLDVDAVAGAPDLERRNAAIRSLDARIDTDTLRGTALVDGVFHGGLTRWFGVLFWFVLLGPAGALLYRLVQLLARSPAFAAQRPQDQHEALERAAQLLDWPAAHLMALALALATDFDTVAGAWRDFHAARGRYLSLDPGFLFAAARASVDSDIESGDTYADDARGPLGEMQEAMALIWRILVVWGVVFALFVLAGKIA
jgi:AmpE protein